MEIDAGVATECTEVVGAAVVLVDEARLVVPHDEG